jgi:hypothetical protein
VPVLSVLRGDGEVAIPAPLKVKVIGERPLNPVPDTVTGVPIGPEVGPMLIAATTLKGLVAVFPNPSMTATVWIPKVDSGTLKYAPDVKLPELSEIAVSTITPS